MSKVLSDSGSNSSTNSQAAGSDNSNGSTTLQRRPSRLPRPASVHNTSAVQPATAQSTGTISSRTSTATASSSQSGTLKKPRPQSIASVNSVSGSQPRDRIHTPGKLRAFFDDVKKTRSRSGSSGTTGTVGSGAQQVNIPQRYKEMLGDERTRLASAASSRQQSISGESILGGSSRTVTGSSKQVASKITSAKREKSSDLSKYAVSTTQDDSVFDKSDGMQQPDYGSPVQSPITSPGVAPTATLVLNAGNSATVKKPVINKGKQAVSGGSKVQSKLNVQKIDDASAKLYAEEADGTASDDIPLSPVKKTPVAKTLQPIAKAVAKPPSTKAPAKNAVANKQISPEPQPEAVEVEEERPPTPEGMLRCSHCERCFSSDRHERHERACTASPTRKQRKVFDGKTLRTAGTEFEKYANKKPAKNAQASVAVKKTDWRKQHEEFIQAIRSAKL